jgi:transcriptional regulator with XRE-family HTH domain
VYWEKGIDMLLADKLEKRRFRLQMSKAEVARRARISLPTVKRVLGGREQRPEWRTLHAIAKALGVTIRLGHDIEIEEDKSPFEYRKERAHAKAKRLVGMVQGTMGLEAQAVDSGTIDQMIEQTTCKLLAGPSRRLWSD